MRENKFHFTSLVKKLSAYFQSNFLGELCIAVVQIILLLYEQQELIKFENFRSIYIHEECISKHFIFEQQRNDVSGVGPGGFRHNPFLQLAIIRNKIWLTLQLFYQTQIQFTCALFFFVHRSLCF